MTEAEWLECNDPQKMLEFLRGKVSDRKLRMFAVACCWRVEGLLTKPTYCTALQITEQHADGLVDSEGLRSAWLASFDSDRYDGLSEDPIANARFWAADAATMAACEEEKADSAARSAACAAMWASPHLSDVASTAEEMEQVFLLRDIFGNPFRSVTLAPACQTATVINLAQAIYADRAFDRMPILGDALEDAGCANADMLNHCRQPGEHVRGCWVADLLLGKS